MSDWNDSPKNPDEPTDGAPSARPDASWGWEGQASSTPGGQGGGIAGDQGPTAPGGPDERWQSGASASSGSPFRLGPMLVGEMLDTTFKLARMRWRDLARVALVYAIPALVLDLLVAALSDHSSSSFGSGNGFGMFGSFVGDLQSSSGSVAADVISGFGGLVLSIAVLPYVQGAITRLVAGTFLGRSMTADEALRGVRPLWGTLAAANLLVMLATFGGLILLIVGAIVVAVLSTAVVPVIAVEEASATRAMSRSWGLVKTRFWGYWGTLILGGILSFLITLVIMLVGFAVGAVLGAVADPLSWLAIGLAGMVGGIVGTCISAIISTLIYFDARVRNEGFDVQMMASRLDQTGSGTTCGWDGGGPQPPVTR